MKVKVEQRIIHYGTDTEYFLKGRNVLAVDLAKHKVNEDITRILLTIVVEDLDNERLGRKI